MTDDPFGMELLGLIQKHFPLLPKADAKQTAVCLTTLAATAAAIFAFIELHQGDRAKRGAMRVFVQKVDGAIVDIKRRATNMGRPH